MTTGHTSLTTSLVLAAAIAGGVAHAAPVDDTGWYLGASVGQSDFSYAWGGDHDNDAFAFHGGYRFNRYFAIEGGYADQGDEDYRLDCPTGNLCVPESYPVLVDQSFRRADIALMGILPVGERFDVFAKLGHARVRYDWSAKVGITPTQRGSDDFSETLYGAGGRWHMNPAWSLRLAWDRHDLGGGEVNNYWLGIEYRFGR